MKERKVQKTEKKLSGEQRLSNKTRLSTFKKNFHRDWQLHLLLLLPLIYVLIFYYWPMYGAQIAFRDFRPRAGITGSEWVGLEWFEKFIHNYNFQQVFGNTIKLALYSIVFEFPLPIIFALLLNCVPNEKLKKVIQNLTYIPHFISTVVLIAIMNQVFNVYNGLYGTLYALFGGEGYPVDFKGLGSAFRALYIGTEIWQNLGWNAIIYIAALGGVSPELHEAAMIDGASRFKRLLHVDLPAILPTIGIMLILRFGGLMSFGFEKAYLMQTNLNLETAEIIPTYVYKVAMGSSGDFSYGAAIGLFNSVINCVLLILVNFITKKVTKDEVSMF